MQTHRDDSKTLFLIVIVSSVVISAFLINPTLFFSEWGPGRIKYSVESSPADQLTLVFKQPTIDYRRNPFFIIEIYDLDPKSPDKRKTIWSIQEIEGPTQNKLDSLTYGKCPPGFSEKAPAEPLVAGHYYSFISDVIKKIGPGKYEIIPFDRYKKEICK